MIISSSVFLECVGTGIKGQHQILHALYDQASGVFDGFVPKVFSIVGVFIDVFSVLVYEHLPGVAARRLS